MRNFSQILVFVGCLIVGLSGISSLARADWREDIGVFRIGIIAKGNIPGALARVEPFRLAIAEALEMDVEFFPASGNIALIDALVAERIEYAILSTSGYALASIRCECVEPLVIPRSSDSTDGYHLIGIVRQGEKFRLNELSTKNIAMVSSDAVLGQNFLQHLLKAEIPNFGDNADSFAKPKASEEVQQSFVNGEYDILFGWSSLAGDPSVGYSRGTLRLMHQQVPASNMKIVWKSAHIPNKPHVVRSKLPGEAKTRLRDALVNLFERDPVAYDSIEPIYGGGFTAARDEKFRLVIDYLQTLNRAEQ